MDAAAVRKLDRRVHVCDEGEEEEGRGKVKSYDTLKWLLLFLLTQKRLGKSLLWRRQVLEQAELDSHMPRWEGLVRKRGSRKACSLPPEEPLQWLIGTGGPFWHPSFFRAHLQIGVNTVSGSMFPFPTDPTLLWSSQKGLMTGTIYEALAEARVARKLRNELNL